MPTTLAQGLQAGRLAAQEAVRYSVLLAEALHRLHASGKVHGRLTPSVVLLDESRVELAVPESEPAVTPYTAPEVVKGGTADQRSDIFSFGAIAYELLTGQKAFPMEKADALAQALCDEPVAPSGSPTVDKLIQSCTAKNPAERPQAIQKILLNLRLMAAVAQRANTPRMRPVDHAQLRQMEDRLASRLAEVEGRLERLPMLENAVDSMRATLQQADAMMNRLAGKVSEMQGVVQKQETVAGSQVTQMESLRTALGQTDDLVERVVEALETLQAIVLENSAEAALR